jgi:hypothetical protein
MFFQQDWFAWRQGDKGALRHHLAGIFGADCVQFSSSGEAA